MDATKAETLESALWSSFEEDPFGLSACALADWLEENGDQIRADAVRWMRRNRRAPLCDGKRFFWFDGLAWDSGYPGPENLPHHAFVRLKDGPGTFCFFSTFEEAVDVLAGALLKERA